MAVKLLDFFSTTLSSAIDTNDDIDIEFTSTTDLDNALANGDSCYIVIDRNGNNEIVKVQRVSAGNYTIPTGGRGLGNPSTTIYAHDSGVEATIDTTTPYFDRYDENTPTGVIQMYGGSSAPDGWLMCDGSSVLRNDYLPLFAVISTSFGAADGSHFNLPNFCGRTPVGVGTGTGGGATGTGSPTGGDALTARALGSWTGAETHTMTAAELFAHTHTQNAHTHGGTVDGTGTHIHGMTSVGGYGAGSPNAGAWRADANSPANFWGMHTDSGDGGHTHSLSVSNQTAVNQTTGSSTAFSIFQPTLAVNFIIKT